MQINILKHQTIAQFGFMHLMATNLCLWLRTLILEINAELNHASVADSSSNTTANNSTNRLGLMLNFYSLQD